MFVSKRQVRKEALTPRLSIGSSLPAEGWEFDVIRIGWQSETASENDRGDSNKH
jgi:hypothetical protein